MNFDLLDWQLKRLCSSEQQYKDFWKYVEEEARKDREKRFNVLIKRISLSKSEKDFVESTKRIFGPDWRK